MESIPPLADLPAQPYWLNGDVSPAHHGQIGVYAILDRDRTVVYVGRSRDMGASLRLHGLRQLDRCAWVKSLVLVKPNGAYLQAIQQAWREQTGVGDPEVWEKPLDCRPLMTPAEEATLAQAATEGERAAVLKNVARRVETEILGQLAAHGLTFAVRFDPKRKSEGILDVRF
ncbi:MAG: GIY-YIG nuclease family protein [Oscillatoriales cyanobacterium SM2_1_8]|nr:GIY-YIG nuclease family protein [Oscillatoriales cyanobacterium SM2_1_8]